ncbi:MAG: ABC transporter ATP-binding protein [Alphaproteobacteria bacterium]|nr:ABC transporter ATP-binding protein [Alphaproteobacteria bacterium]
MSEASAAPPILAVDRLVVVPQAGGGPVVDGISLTIARGEVLALIGESGSGKTTLALAALGHVRPGLAVRSGRVRLGTTDVLGADNDVLRDLRGRRVTYVAQSAAASFNPTLRLDSQVTEPSLVHRLRPRADALSRAHALYRRLDLPAPEQIGERFPHEVSGGQLQRFMIAMGLIEGPELVVCDEPTSALDVTTQVEVLKALKSVIRDGNTAGLFVSHDLAVVAQIADRILVLRQGKPVEEGITTAILAGAREPYTKELIAACRRWNRRCFIAEAKAKPAPLGPPRVEVSGVTAGFGPRDRATGRPAILAVNDAQLSAGSQELVAIIGESGSGKTTLAQIIAGLHRPAAGKIFLSGKPLAPTVARRSLEERRRIQIVFQNADTALNPRHSVGRILSRVLAFFHHVPRAERSRRIAELLQMVRLPPSYAGRRPGELSGGEKQRVSLARALAAEPEVLICDEITSALDTIVAAAIIRLVEDLRERLGLAIIFISHDLATVAELADRVLVMRRGEIVEQGTTRAVLDEPRHAYTRLLLASVPELRVGWLEEAAGRRADLAWRSNGIPA